MNDSDESKPDNADAEQAAPKPRRKRAPRKVADAATAAPEAAAEAPVPAPTAEAAPSGDAAEPVAAPKPRAPRRKRVAAADAAPEAAATAVTETAAQAAPPAAEPVPAAQPHAVAEPSMSDRGDEPADGSADNGDAAAGADGAAPREGRRRNRRRRNRDRDRADRPPRADAAPGDEAAAPAESDDGDDAPAAPVAPLEPTDPNELFANVLSGEFDATQPAEVDLAPADPAKRVLLPEPDAPKLHKVLAQAGIGSRRDMEQWVLEGRVTVNGEPAHTGQRISFGDRITVNGKPVKVRIAPLPPRVLAYHKPAGEVVTHDDPQHRPTVFRRLPRLPHGKWQSVGRLDINTEGLLLFTNSGELANQLMHPRFGVEREYAVRSLGVLGEEQRARLLEGVEIEGQRCGFKSIEDGGGEGANHWYRVVITEGRNREVRKLFEAVGHAVSRLIRIRYGCVVLPRGLKRGVWVDLPEPDVRALRRLTGTERPREAEGDGPGGRNKRGRRGGRNRDRDGRGPRPDGGPRGDNPPRQEGQSRQDGDFPLNIPNPLQQTYDKRAIQQVRRQNRRELTEDDPIPNPLQQTYDRRALQSSERQPPRDLPDDDGPLNIPNPLQQTYDKRFVQKGGGTGLGGGGGGRGRRRGGAGGGGGGGQRQPDPMQTAVGYIGADAFRNKGGGKGGGKGRRGGGKPGGGGGGGGGNRGGGGGRNR